MFVRRLEEAPARDRVGLRSWFLLQAGDLASDALSVTWVVVQPSGAQATHRHEPEQVYVIVGGTGRMAVGEQEAEVRRGDLVHIPSNVPHAIANTGDEPLVYVSAAVPAFSLDQLYDSGDLHRG